jgi:hypothetical protein
MDMRKTFAILLLVALASVGGWSAHVVNVDMQGEMSGCPFMGTALCQMNPLEHLSAWQGMLAYLPGQAVLSTLLALVLFLALGFPVGTIPRLSQSPPLRAARARREEWVHLRFFRTLSLLEHSPTAL